ncbi:Enthanolamine kinase [Blumeria hordei DH14]|uniref:Enthanolamine kinase n=1 Tax=Blumeria graminis f. sp. hordei (strain DH14) TaxID=546991 RepID=N1JIK8_BLUG1|nr:Enthanolamine kinase [Blumeria hordei DH14]
MLRSRDNCYKNKQKSSKEIREWATFKLEILKIGTHFKTKRVEKIYVVTPPVDVETLNSKCIPSRYPSKVLLRIYGPQVEHLIDRKNELSILKRLSQKKIGARMLGTFINGRFEEYLNAKPLTAKDMRMADTSVQIAKRMRELHDGVELLDREREDGPFVWRNWDKWVDRCEKIMTVLDQIVKVDSPRRSGLWKSRDFVCGVEWPLFKSAVNRYRQWLNDHYGKDGVKQKLIFAHNDTQYGNILRLIPDNTVGSSPSPLLLPANSHKQLVVIDFEYASANTPGLEFANHFTEWCYNYHEPKTPWACNTSRYPSIDEQIRFIRSYVTHQSRFYSNTSTTANMPLLDNMKGRGGEFCLDNIKMEICDFGVDDSTVDYTAEETQLENEVKHQIQELLCDVRRWRVANSAQWVAWGIVQAQVPGLDHSNGKLMAHESRYTTEDVEAHELTPEDSLTELDIQEGEAGFDYLSYASDRALFFWGDMVQLGIIREEELPTELLARLKTVNNH